MLEWFLPVPEPKGDAMRVILCGLMAVSIFGLSLAADDKKEEKIDTKKLIGKWEPKEQKAGITLVIEFEKDGKMTNTASNNGKEMKFEGTYKVEGNKLTTTMKLRGKEQTTTRTVTKLSDTELVSTTDQGKEDTLIRIKDK